MMGQARRAASGTSITATLNRTAARSCHTPNRSSAMPGRGKHRGCPGLASPSCQRRRTEEAEGRRNILLRAIGGFVVGPAVVASGLSNRFTSEVRAPVYEPARMEWQDHAADIGRSAA